MAKPFLLTTSWDDGSIHDLKLAELLAKYELPATFYVARNSEFRGMSDNDIQRVGRSFELGSHTVNHVLLNSLADDAALAEIADSKTWTEQLSGRPCRMFCFPNGKFKRSQLQLVKEAGFWGARTTELMSVAFPSQSLGVVVVPTTVQAFPHAPSAYLRNIGRRLAVRNVWNFVSHGLNRNWVTTAQALLRHVSIHGGVFHLWGHSWELEANDSWLDIEIVLRSMAAYRNSATYLTNGEICGGLCSLQSGRPQEA